MTATQEADFRFTERPLLARPRSEDTTMDMNTLWDLPPWDWPPHAKGEILAVLKNRAAPERERLMGAELAGNLAVINDELATELLRILGDPGEGENLRAMVAVSLGPVLAEMHDPFDIEMEPPEVRTSFMDEAGEALRRCYQDPDNPKLVRRLALEASVRVPASWHPRAIRAAYLDDDGDWRTTAVCCMRFVPGFDHEIVESLRSRETGLLYEAVSAARDQCVEGAWPYVRSMVLSASRGEPLLPHDPDWELQLLMAAMGAVGKIRPLEAHETLGGLVDSPDREVAEGAMYVLDMVEDLLFPEDEEEDEEFEEEDDDFPFPIPWVPKEPTWH
jgi:hypothetical protein